MLYKGVNSIHSQNKISKPDDPNISRAGRMRSTGFYIADSTSLEDFRMFRSASLFSGCGGMDYGILSSRKFTIEFANEILPVPALTYSRNFHAHLKSLGEFAYTGSSTMFNCDVANVDFDLNQKVEVLFGGPPCQDFSVVRGPPQERKGIEVKRGKLYEHFIRGLRKLQPLAFVFENVPGLVNANGGHAYASILEDFENLTVRWHDVQRDLNIPNGNGPPQGYYLLFNKIVNSAHLGVPQSRRRLIVVGIRKDVLRASDLSEAKSAFSDELYGNRLLVKFPLTPIEAFEGRPLQELNEKYIQVMEAYKGIESEVVTSKAAKWKSSVWRNLKFDIIADYKTLNKIECAEQELEEAFKAHQSVLKELGYAGTNVASLNLVDGTNAISDSSKHKYSGVIDRLRMIPPGENHEFVEGTKWSVNGKGMSLIYRRLSPIKPSYTVVAFGGGGTWGYHYERERSVLTNRERARLQTFPDNFEFAGTTAQIRAQIGEAVPPLLAKRISNALHAVLVRYC